MTNEEYQQQARERRARAEREAAYRRGIEDYNRQQKQQREREAEARKRAYSKKMGQMNAIPSPFGPAVDMPAYREGKQQYDALQRSTQAMNSTFTPRYSSAGAASQPRRRSGSGGALLFVCAIIAAFVYFGSSHKDTSSSTSPVPSTVPVTLADKPTASISAADQTSTQSAASQQFPKLNFGTADSSSAADSPQSNANSPLPATSEANPVENAAERTPTGNPAQTPTAELANAYETSQSPWPSQGQRYAAEHKGMDGCKGELLLASAGLQFYCIQNPGRSFSIPLNEIREQDGDGIKLYSGKKYHFNLYTEKMQTEVLFTQWLYRARLSRTPAQ